MTAAVIVYVLIVTLPLLAAAALVEKTCRLWSWPVRGAWAATALLTLLICGRTVARQMVAPPATTSIALVEPTHLASAPATSSRIASLTGAVMALPRNAAAQVAHVVGPTPDRWLAILWGIMSIIVLALVISIYTRVWHARRAWSITQFGGHQVRVAPHAGPAVVGLFRTEIVVPRWALESRPEDSRLIVLHEMEHRNAKDPMLLAAMWMLVALLPWHPGAWYCLARTRLAIELDCDARVVRRGESLRSYAQLLLNQASARLSAPLHLWLGATSLLQPSSHLERRLRAMTTPRNESPSHRPVARYLRTLSYIAVVSTIAIAACESHVPTAADISGLDAAGAEKNARQISLIDADQAPTYYVDGVVMSAAKAQAILPESIKSISVVRDSKEPGGEIRIVTGRTLDLTLQPDMANGSRPENAAAIHPLVLRLKATPSNAAVANPAIEIDGVPSNAAAMHALKPDQIASIEVVKGPAALKESSDPLAKNGLIRVTLKH